MELSDTFGSRFDLLLSQLREGKAIEWGRVALTLLPDELVCAVGTLMDRRTVTERRARDALGRARGELEALLNDFPALAATVGGRPVRYVLVHGLERWGTRTDIAEWVGDDFRWLDAVPPVHRTHPPVQTEQPLRHLTRSELRRRSAELHALLDEWDPYRSERSRRKPQAYEYEPLVGPILRYLETKEPVTTIAQFLREELTYAQLELLQVSPEEIADRIHEWYMRRWPDTDSAPSGR